MQTAALEYHLRELEIALDPSHPKRSVPAIPAGARRVLDVGCGIGQTLIALNAGPHVEVHGVDVDAEAVRYGRAKFPHLQLAVAGGEQLPYDDAKFDLLICRVSLPYMHVPRAISEFSRVLVDGGILWITRHSLGMFRHDLAAAVRSGNARSIAFRTYAFANSFLPVAGLQVRYPLNTERMESYQPAMVLNRILKRSQFHSMSLTEIGGTAYTTAVRQSRKLSG